MFISGAKISWWRRVEKPLPIRLEDTVCLEEGRAPGPTRLAVVLKDMKKAPEPQESSRSRGIRGEAEAHRAAQETHEWSMHNPDRLEGWPAGQPKKAWLDLLFTPTEGPWESWALPPRHLSTSLGPGTTSSSEALASDKNMMNQRETSDASPLRPMGHHRRRWRLTLSYSRASAGPAPPFVVFRAPASIVRGEEKRLSQKSAWSFKLLYFQPLG